MIDWTPVTTAIVALIAVLISTFIPLAIKLFFDAWSAKLEKLKATIDANQEIVRAIVTVVQQTLGTLSNSEKYHVALARANEVLNLPVDTLHDMIELAIAEAKLAWGTDWDELSAPPSNPPTA
jgi:hypothetical protein